MAELEQQAPTIHRYERTGWSASLAGDSHQKTPALAVDANVTRKVQAWLSDRPNQDRDRCQAE